MNGENGCCSEQHWLNLVLRIFNQSIDRLIDRKTHFIIYHLYKSFSNVSWFQLLKYENVLIFSICKLNLQILGAGTNHLKRHLGLFPLLS